MVKVLQDLWILASDSGIVLYSRTFDNNVDVQLFGGLMSALNSFAEVLSKEGLTSFELSDKRFAIIKRKNISIIGNASTKVKEKKLIEELQIIADKFFVLYSDILDNWDGDINLFSNFEEKIEDSLEETVDKFKKAFW
ncbi:MAG: hypothetical protein GF317_04250 [Candidatus Lokiarchaeota archaeon]|nr:hypothetical protein [Candidatus Lokiarchaeota archaeon]MBD3199100.1 hypothetical protein [Candidatus Lokiarchaeota archaeon]